MRLIDEVFTQADHQLKSEINAQSALFIEVVKRLSLIKGTRWDEIVCKFEYEFQELPSFLKQIQSSSIAASHKDYLTQ
jgi:hypothetical protein